jgi:carotenoid epsilon hydroxylase
VDLEACFSQMTLDVIGKAVFNYDFDALTTDSPLIQVRMAKHGSASM